MIYYLDNTFGGIVADKKRLVKKMSIEIPKEQIADFCQKWKIVELSLFGSVLRDDFRPDSDVDVLVSFSHDADWSLLDHMAMEEELEVIFDRKIDLVNRKAIERSGNYIRRKAILETAQPYYVTR